MMAERVRTAQHYPTTVRRRWHTLSIAALLPALAACHSVLPLASESAIDAPLPVAWQLRGRVVLHAVDQRRISGWLHWRQRGEQHYELTVSHALGAALRLEWNGIEACLRRGDAVPECAPDPMQLTQRLSGGEPLPMAQLGHWLLGRASPGDTVLGDPNEPPRQLLREPWQLRFGSRLRRGSARSLPREIELWHDGRLVLHFRPQAWLPAGHATP